MELRVVGCHGGETARHKTSAFLVDDRLAIDAGSLASGLDLSHQFRLSGCLVSHVHLDHIKDLAMLADNRCQAECEPLPVAASRATLRSLRKHVFNDHLCPDFTRIPSPESPTIRLVELRPGRILHLAGYQIIAVPVNHTIETFGFMVRGPDATLAYSGDTGPTDLLWDLLAREENLKALLMEVSFPNRKQKLATMSGHHTPRTLRKDLEKYPSPSDLPTLLYHIKPTFQSEVEQECARLKGVNLTVLAAGDHFVL